MREVGIIMLLCMLALMHRNLFGNDIKELKNLNEFQQSVLINTIHYAESYNYDKYKYVLAAIAWQESSFGLNNVNPDDGLYGAYCPFQILTENALDREGYQHTDNNIAIISSYLLSNFEYCIENAIKELMYWEKERKRGLDKAIASYRTGNRGTTKTGKKYFKNIKKKANIIKKYWEEF